MKSTIYVIVIFCLLSCKKEENNNTTKSIYIGSWKISQKIFIEPGEPFSDPPYLPIQIDTVNQTIGKAGIVKPLNQKHETFINSNYLTFDSNSALEISAYDLGDAQSAYIFKSELFDISKINNITLSIHAEQLNADKIIKDYDVAALIRICSDTNINDNYYQIERPLIISNISTNMWPIENFINFDMKKFISLKTQRDSLATNISIIFSNKDNGEIYSIKNNPDFSKINRICFGIKNPGDHTSFITNDMLPKSVKIWIY